MFRKTVLVRALSIAFSTAALTAIVAQPVMAQSNAVGTIFGQAAAGTSVVVKNAETNLQRKATADATGRFTVTALPVGRYKVDLVKGDKVVSSTEVEVSLGQGVEAVFAAAAGVETVKITGQRKRIDVSTTNNGAVFSSKELAKLPITPSVDSIIQLAPNTTRVDDRYQGASFGGSGASENAYYINGFPVTNPITGMGSSELPFGAVAQAGIQTGGFGAEFGRSIGGVVNITTKSGTNNWEAGALFSIEPRGLRSKFKDFRYANTGKYPAGPTAVTADGLVTTGQTDDQLRLRREDNEVQETRLGVNVGGPIVQDKLFMFLAADETTTKTSRVGALRNTANPINSINKWGWGEIEDTVTRYLVKLDWNISDAHRLEFTAIGDDSKQYAKYYSYNYATRARGNTVNSGEHYHNDPANTKGVGGDSQILKYVGNFTDNLTFTALYGRQTVEHDNTFDGYDVFDLSKSIAQVSSLSICPGDRQPTVFGANLKCNNNQPLVGTIMPKDGKDDISNWRLGLEWKLGSHTITMGGDQVKLHSANTGFITAGGSQWRYFRQTAPGVGSLSQTGVSADIRAGAAAGSPASEGYWARQEIFSSATPISSQQSSQFIEDKWQVNKTVLLSLGLRNEQFKNINGDGETYLDMRGQLSPRLGASWDVNGDASMKVFGSAGRYYLQVPSSVGVRGAARSLFTRQPFTYTGMDANGLPTGLVSLGKPFSTNNEYNQSKDPKVVSSIDTKPNFQDEMTLGFEKQFSPSLNFGAKFTYRKLKSTIDDICDDRAFNAYFARLYPDPAVRANKLANWGGFGCASFNPGEDNDFLVDLDDANPDTTKARKNYTRVHLTAADIGMPTPERVYTAIDLFAEHPLRDGWYGRINYTWSKSKGNTEGQTRSDNGQLNPGSTTTWDTRELPENTNGLLPNDRTHQIKAFGFYDITPEWTVGGNLLIASGRPISCFGNHPKAGDFANYDYGSAYNYCGNDKDSLHTATPRGSLGKLPTDIRLDMNVVYKPAQVKGLALKMDIFNLFNKQTAQRVNETYNTATDTINPEYGRIMSYTAPRAVRLTAEYNHKF